jgi:hypothetical protein
MAKKKPATQPPEPLAPPPLVLPYIAEDLRALAIPIDQLVPDPRNARKHDERNVATIANSLKRFGQLKPIVVNVANMVVEAGNGTVAAARLLGWTHLAAVKVVHDEATQTGFALADNRTAELATWDDVLLAQLVVELAEQDATLPFDLALAHLIGQSGPMTPLATVDLTKPPAMTWVLIGIPTVRFGEASAAVELLSGVPGIIMESTSNDGGPQGRQ